MGPCEYTLSLQNLLIGIECVNKEGRCGYHTVNQHFRYTELFPAGLCPEAYHNLHCASLGLLFNATFSEKQLVAKCPGTENYVVFKAGFDKLNLRFRLLNLVKYLLYRIYPGQIFRGRLFWTVTEIKGKCPLEHKVGSRFYINLGNLQITQDLLFPLGEPHSICPAVFDNLFPYLQSYRLEKAGSYFGGLGNRIQCPDHLANITFKISGPSG
jgi:uncharacterized repeat protein (TIGR04076 family)